MMRTLVVGMVLVAFTAITIETALGQKVRTRNSASWAYKFEGGNALDANTPPMPNFYNYVPTGTGWDSPNDPAAGITSMGHSFPGGVAPTMGHNYGRGFLNDQSTTWSAEVKALLEAGTNILITTRGLTGGGPQDFSLIMKQASASINIGAPGGGPSFAVPFDMSDGFHTYRITKEDQGDNTSVVNIYVDGETPLATWVPTIGAGGNEATIKTSAPWTLGSVVQVDHFRFQPGKALALPEPASLALLGLGALTIVLRRRRTSRI